MKRILIIALLLGLTSGAPPRRTSAATAPAQSAGDPLELLPDGMGVAVINIKQMVASDVWALVMGSSKVTHYIERAEADLNTIGLKVSDLGGVAVAVPPTGGGLASSGVVAAWGSFNPSEILAKLKDNSKVKVTSQKYKSIDVYRVVSTDASNHMDVSFAFYDTSTAVAGPAAGVKAAIDVRTGDKPSMAKNATLDQVMAQNSSSAIRFAIIPPNGSLSAIQSPNLPLPDFSSINLIFGTVAVTSAVDISATLRSDTADHAKAIANQLNSLLSMAKGFMSSSNPKMAPIADALKTVTINETGGDVTISASLSKDVISQFIH
jgi:hypothetical protein